MQRNFSSRKSAFSLIELAIVLIIIGLLIAGITGGAALIKSAELRAAATEARSNSVSASAFYSLYDSLPGDSNKYTGYVKTTNAAVGNADGRIQFCNTTCTDTVDMIGSEGGAIAWGQLNKAGIINFPTFTAAAGNAASQTPGTNFPASKSKGGGWVFDYDTAYNSNVTLLVVSDSSAYTAALAGSTHNGLKVLTGSDMAAIDTKNDDGNPSKGKIRVQGGQSSTTAVAVTDCSTNTGTYVMTATTKACTVLYDLDVGGN